MFLRKLAFLFLFTLCFIGNGVFAQGTSNKGTDFWLAYGNHVKGYGTNAQRMFIYIASDVTTSGTVTFPGGVVTPFSVSANSVTNVDVPQSAYLGGVEGKINPGAIHVVSLKPVVVYSHIYNANVSGATLVLPTNTLGKEYYSINYTQVSNEDRSYSYFFVIAVEDNTQIVITPSAATQGGLVAGQQSPVITLNKGEVYQVLGTETSRTIFPANNGFNVRVTGTDLTGSTIKSVSTTAEPCKRIAVFSGSGKVSIGCLAANGQAGSADNLFQQVYPTATWGNKFITVPLKGRNYDIFRILKSDPTAVVRLNGVVIPAFSNGVFHEFSSQSRNIIESDKPIQVVQYAVSEDKSINCTNFGEAAGDPEMIFLNPLEQTLNSITMYSSPFFRILTHFINVVIRTSDVGTFKLDGMPQAANFTPVTGNTEYSSAQLTVSEGIHTLNADGGFNAIAYGFGQAESYGYAAGANLVTKGVEAINSKLQLSLTGCVNEPFTLQIPLPYEPTGLRVDFGKGNGQETVSLKQTSSYQERDKTYFVYELVQNLSFDQVKTYNIRVFAAKVNDGCGSEDQFDLDFPVYAPPTAGFSAPPEVCATVPLTFRDESIPDAVNKITKWLWDFGDGTPTSAEQHPTHVFAAKGVYAVKLIASGESGCSSTVYTGMITVNAVPLAKFTYGVPDCATKDVVFTDASTSIDGTIISWRWNFGDGDPVITNPTNAPVSHAFAAAGVYPVTLTVTTDKGCISVASTQQVTIYPQPIANFDMPGICQLDGTARFTSTSTSVNGSPLSYSWTFGDNAQNVTAQNPNISNQPNPSHSYALAGDYTVTLTVLSADGCSDFKSQVFTVNGSTPQASFTVQNPGSLCSSQPVNFVDNSSVAPGSLTKIEWYFDDGNALVPVQFFDKPKPGAVYTYSYPLFSSPATRTVTVRLVAYSGTACSDVSVQTITLKAVPSVTFDAVAPICLEKPPVQLLAAETTGFQGTPLYSGRGVSSSGLFDPVAAGVGKHLITFTFTGGNGCVDQKTQEIEVYPTPTVNAGKDAFILQGGETRLKAIATGSNVSYAWSPVTGLSDATIANPVASPLEDITYTLTVTSDQGCSAADEIFIKVLKSPLVPNTFTPNGDGINDLWNIQYLESYPGATVQIFNRYGGKLLATVGYSKAWDGTSNGAPVPVGVYYYIIDPKNGRKLLYGSVTVIR